MPKTKMNFRTFAIVVAIQACFSPALVLGINTEATGFQINASQTVTVDVHSDCKQVTNSTSNSLFVPTKTSTEWSSFQSHLPTNVTLGSCNTPPPTWNSGTNTGGSISGSAWSAPGGWNSVKGGTGRNSGKYCFDFYFTGGDNDNHDIGISAADVTYNAGDWPGNVGGWAGFESDVNDNGVFFFNPGTTGWTTVASGSFFSSGTHGRVCVDFTNQKMWVSNDKGASWLGGGDPASNSAGMTFSKASSTWHICASDAGVATVTLESDTTNALPTGFSRW